MLALTSPWLLRLLFLGAAVCTIAVVVVAAVRGGDRMTASRGRMLLRRGLPVLVLVLAAQACAVGAVAADVNDQYSFYTSWGDLTGQRTRQVAIQTGGLVGSGQGHLVVRTVRSRDTGPDDRVLVWLPPQYGRPAYRHHRFPVVMFLGGQPSTPQVVFRHFAMGAVATRMIDHHHIPPFIAVFPTLMVSPPRDTECTDIPHGVKAERWLAHAVPRYVRRHFRALPPGRSWSAAGWSTGGFCAAKLLLDRPRAFSGAAAFGAYFTPLVDHTTGPLFGDDAALRHYNSPQWMYQHRGGTHGDRLLVIAGKQDAETWPQTRAFLKVSSGDPHVAGITFPYGGHNYRNYVTYLPATLHYLSEVWGVRNR